MLVNKFVDGEIAIQVTYDVSQAELEELECAIDDAAGEHAGKSDQDEFDGFAKYCKSVLEYVRRNNVPGIEVCYERSSFSNNSFGYMRIGTDYFTDQDIKLVPFREVLEECGFNDSDIAQDFELVFE